MGCDAGGVMTIVCAVPEMPTSATARLPPLLLNVSVWLNMFVDVGENVTLTVTEALAASVAPFPGMPVAENGAVGAVVVANVSVEAPVFVSVIAIVLLLPFGTPPKLSWVGAAVSTGPVD